ncbi:MAG TPA: hypothetical protein VFL83_00865, partial [Anaeromyxobacter sp.]|nr:hypothetical protein [Anaeromyxobacter sp.]
MTTCAALAHSRRPPAAYAFVLLSLAAACSPEREPSVAEIRRVAPSVSAPLRLLRPTADAAVGAEPPPAKPLPGSDPLVAGPVPGAAAAPLALVPGAFAPRDGLGVGTPLPGGSPFVPARLTPDPSGDVGPRHYVQAVNTHFLVLDKAGNVLYGPALLRTLWSGAGPSEGEQLCAGTNPGTKHGDPVVAHDPLADRWVISFQANDEQLPGYQCVAVSATADPAGAWRRYVFGPYTVDPDGPGPTPPVAAQNDYGKLGVWPDAYYVSYAMRDPYTLAVYGSKFCAWERERMLAGEPAREVCHQLSTVYNPPNAAGSGALPADLDGLVLPPAGTPGLFLGQRVRTGSPDLHRLVLWRFGVDWAAAPPSTALTGPVELPVAAFTYPCPVKQDPPLGTTFPWHCVPQGGLDADLLDTVGWTMMSRVAYRVLPDGSEALLANHTVDLGVAVNPQTGVRWYELRNAPGQTLASATPVIRQQGTHAPDGEWRWMGSIAMDQEGNIGLGYSVSSDLAAPTLRYTGRLAADPLGVLTQPEASPLEGVTLGSMTGSPLGAGHWGDRSALSVDPADDCTFWFTGEYLKSDGRLNWSTRIGTFRLPGCPSVRFQITPAATSVQAGQPLGFTVRAVDASGALLPSYAGTVALSVATGTASPAETTLQGGVSTVPLSATFTASGAGTITARDTAYPSRSGSAAVTVAAAAASSYQVSGLPASLGAGAPATLTLRALDPFGNLVTSYAGLAALSSTDPVGDYPVVPRFAGGAAVATPLRLFTVGSQTVTATELNAAAPLTGSATTTVVPGPAFRFDVTGLPSSVAAGAPASVTITARDRWGNVATAYAGVPALSSTDPRARFTPAAPTFTQGVATATAVHETAGLHTMTVADGTISGAASTTVTPGPATRLAVALPSSASTGVPVAISMQALDAYGNLATGYGGALTLASGAGGATFAPAPALSGGVYQGTATFTVPGPQRVTAISGALQGWADVTVAATAPATLALTFPGGVTAGVATRILVEARDGLGNRATWYDGPLALASSAGGATFAPPPAIAAGVYDGLATLTRAGLQTLTATSGVLAQQASTTVAPAAAATLAFTDVPASAVVGVPASFSLEARDAYQNLATSYAGTASLGCTDPRAIFPSQVAFSGGRGGPVQVTFGTTGAATMTATDVGAPSLTGSATLPVTSGALARYALETLPATVTAGTPLSFSVRAVDAQGNTVTGYAGPASLTATGGEVTPATLAFVDGIGGATATVTFTVSGPQGVTVADAATAAVRTSASVTVLPAAAASFSIEGLPGALVAGTAASFSISARDPFGNLATGYAGGAALEATGGTVAPAAATFSGGRSVGALSVTFTAAGSQDLTASDPGPPALAGTRTVSVLAAPASRYLFSGLPASVTAGQEAIFTLTAVDAFGNVDSAYAGTANLACTDPQATHPPTVAFRAGIAADVRVTLRTAGPQTITATDAANPLVKGQTDVNPAAAPPPPQEPQQPQGGCGCGAGASVGVEALALAALLAVRRRRRAP